jgi:hypothetical protein
MAQRPATPKLRRALLRGAAALGGVAVARRLARTDSERAALALRAAAQASLPRAHDVTFLIPLVAPRQVGDWTVVTERLQATLQGLIAQSDSRWRALLCCQQPPPLPADGRIAHLPFDDPAPGNDKWRKLAALCAALPDHMQQPGYVMSFDADDLPHRRLVESMLARQGPGHLVRAGYVMDHATGAVARADAPSPTAPARKPFWKLCGSCAAVLHDAARPESGAFLQAMTAHEHRMFPHLAALAGRPLAPLDFPAVLYVLNHGENFGARRGRIGYKTRFVQRFRCDDAAMRSDLSRNFPAP